MIKRLVWFCIGTGFGFWLAVRLGRTVRSRSSVTPRSSSPAGWPAPRPASARTCGQRWPRVGWPCASAGRAALEGQLIDPLDSGHGRGSEM